MRNSTQPEFTYPNHSIRMSDTTWENLRLLKFKKKITWNKLFELFIQFVESELVVSGKKPEDKKNGSMPTLRKFHRVTSEFFDLKEVEMYVFELRMGLANGKVYTQRQIAEELGVSIVDVQQIERNSLRFVNKKLAEYINDKK